MKCFDICNGLPLPVAVVGMICMGSAMVHAEDSLTTLADDCQTQLALQQDSTGGNLLAAAACPQFTDALRDSNWRDTLIGITPDSLTIEQLKDFAILTEGYATAVQSNPSLSRQSLDTILQELPRPLAEERSAWERVWDWLKTQFEAQTATNLSTLLEKLTGWIKAEWVLSILQLGVCAATLAALVIFVRELRRAGVFGRRNKPVDGTDQLSAATPCSTSIAVPLRLQPAVLLGALVARLQGSALPPQAPGMTVHEIFQHYTSLADPEQEQFTELASGAERIAYAAWQPDDSQLHKLVMTGETLLQKMSRKTGA